MAEQFTKPYKAQASYGSSAVNNRVKPGGTLGSNQYYYTTNAKTGTITVNRYYKDPSTGAETDLEVATIKQGSNVINVNSSTSTAETSFFSTPSNISKVRQQALQVAQREWDGRTQPAPTIAVYGENAINKAFDPSGSGTHATSTKNTQTAAKNSALGALDQIIQGESPAKAAREGINSFLGTVTKTASTAGLVAVYPSAIAQSGQDYVKFEKLKYQAKQKNTEGFGWGKRNPNRKPQGTVVLPIPGGISDTSQVSWGQDKMGPLDTALANIAMEGIEGGAGGAVDQLEREANIAKGAGADVKDALKKQIAGQATGTGAQLLTRTEGKILNPNMELLFKDPSLRPFNFTWKLAPRSKDEALDVIKIIRFFKQGMAPTRSARNLFLESPMTWRITYMNNGSPHKYLNKFKECALQSFTVSYTPDGNYATFEDGIMTAYQITMNLTELEPVFSNDYDGVPGLGY